MDNNQQTQTGDNQQAAAGQGQNQQPQQNQQQAPQIPDDLKDVAHTNSKGQVMVPLAALTDERTKRQSAENKNKALEDERFLHAFQQPVYPQGQAPQTQPQPQPNMMQQQATGTQFHAQPQQTHMQPQTQVPTLFEGINGDEMLTVDEAKNELNKVINFVMQNAQPQGPTPDQVAEDKAFGELVCREIHPDADKVLMGDLREKINANPGLAQTIANVRPKFQALVAYRIAKGQSEQQAILGAQQDVNTGTAQVQNQSQINQTTQQIVDNANKPPATSTIVNAGGLNQVDRFNAMDDDELEAEIAKVKGG